MRKFLVLLFCLLLVGIPLFIYGASETPTHTQTLSPFPMNQASFFRDMQVFLANEDANRYRLMFAGFVSPTWPIPSPSVGVLSQSTAPLEAFVNGFYVFQPITVLTFPASARTFLFLDWFDTRVGQTPSLPDVSFTGGTGCTAPTRLTRFLMVRCLPGSEAPTPSVNVLLLISVDTDPTSITAVQLLAETTPLGALAGNADTATSLAANGANCSAGQFPRGVDAFGAAENCTPLPTTVTGTANQISVSASTGPVVVSIPNNPVFPGTITGNFSGPLTGNASTASNLAGNGANCSAGQAPLGVDAAGATEGCYDVATQAELDTHTGGTAVHGATGAVVGTTNTQTLQNKTLDVSTIATLRDDRLTLQDNADVSKQAILELSGIPTATTRTVTIAGGANSVTVKPTACLTTDKVREIQADGTVVCDSDQAGGGGTGITSLNTLGTTTQLFATGTTGTDFGISSVTSTHTFNLPDAGATARGVVTTGAQTFAGAKTFSGGVIAAVTGNASTCTALAANPADCSANQFGTAIAANGDLTCAQVGYAQLSGIPSTLVKTDQANTYSTGAQSFAAATSLTVPLAAGASPTVSGQVAYDLTSNTLEAGVNGVNKTIAMTDSSITGNAATATLSAAATALAANGANCVAGQFPLGVDAAGAAESCTALPTTITGTANQITASASTGPVTVSITTNPTLPGTTTGTFSGNLTGNASTATALAAAGTSCPAGNSSIGIDASGNAQGCFDVATQVELDAAAASVFDEDGQLANPAVSTGSFIINGSGPPQAGSCPHDKATYRDTVTAGDTYVCYGLGENWHLIGEHDNYTRIPDSFDACTAATSGTIKHKINPTGVANQFLICTKLPDNLYYWVGAPQIFSSSSITGEACEASPADDFLSWDGAATPTESVAQIQSASGYYTHMVSRTIAAIPSPQVMTMTFRRNGGDTPLSCTQQTGATTSTCTSNAVVSVTEGQLVNFRESCTTGGAATKNVVTVHFYPN